jgi:AcrR family transcriptional regulator
MPIDVTDARAERSRAALLAAFFDLVQQTRYDDIRIADILARADVSRSTFYAHFAGKDALLAASIAGPFSVLADTLTSDSITSLVALLDHFWERRALARSILREPVRRRVTVVLTAQIEQTLRAGGAWKRGPLLLPERLAAVQLAEMLLAPLIAWLAGEASCSSAALASALHRISVAALDAMTSPSRS